MSGKNFSRRPSRKNYGMGRTMEYAAYNALRRYYCDGNFSTRSSHLNRFRLFVSFIFIVFNIRDVRKVEADHLVLFAKSMGEQVSFGIIKVSYAQNIISSVNVVMKAFGHDVYLSPVKFIGRRGFIRTRPVEFTDDDVEDAKNILLRKENDRAAAVLLLCRAFGVRMKEACLADIDSWVLQNKEDGQVVVLEGCKGGRRCMDRTIPVGSRQQMALEFAVKSKPVGSSNLLATDERLIDFINKVLKPARTVLRGSGIINFRELRVAAMCDVFENAAGIPAPIRQKPRPDQSHLVAIGLAAVAVAAGHVRPDTSRSYVG